MKKIYTTLIGITLLFAAAAPTSCSDDKDQNTGGTGQTDQNLLIGSWIYSDPTFTETYTFLMDGSMIYSFREGANQGQYTGTYTFNPATRILTTVEEGYTYIHTVVALNSSTLTMVDSDGESWTYHRM